MARHLLVEAAGQFAGRGDSPGEIRARTSLVTFLGFDGDFESAFEQLEAVRLLLREGLPPGDRALILIAEAHYLMLKGEDLDRAHRRLRTARDLLSSSSAVAPRDRLECLRSLVTVTLDLGLQSESHQYAREAKRLALEIGTLRDQVSTGYNAIYRTTRTELPDDESRARVLGELHSLRRLAERAGYAEVEAQARRLLAEMEGGAEADSHLELCRVLARSIRDPDLERRCLLAMASRRIEDDPGRARELLNEAYAAGLANPGPWALFYGWADHLRVLWATESRERSLAGADVVLGAIEALRRGQVGGASNRLLSAWADAYYWQAGKLLEDSPERGETRRAFAVIERLRAQTLREVLEQDRETSVGLPEEIASRRRNIELDLAGIYRRLLDPSLYPAERTRALERLGELEVDEAELESRLAVRGPRPPSYGPPDEDLLDRVIERLDEDEALLSFQLGLWRGWDQRFLGGSWLLVATRSGSRVYPLAADRASIEPWVKAFLGLPEPQGRPAARLYRETLEEALEELDPRIDKLILVPDGLLHLLPFAALRQHPESKPLVDRFELSLVPSADLWLRWRDPRGEVSAAAGPPPAALVIANPTLPTTERPAAVRAWALASGAELGALPYAEREGRSVVRRFGGATRLVSKDEASEAFLKQENLEAYGVVHFAAHAVTDSERPQRSAILLASGNQAEDGFLRPAEIARLRGLEGRLVVLSSCNSASGSVLRGEGVLSLARAFFEAGAHAVVGSLWRLDDRDAAAFFDDFYHGLAGGLTVSEAVARTQRRWAAKGRPPSAWAGIVVLGDGNLVPLPGGAAGFRFWPVAAVIGIAVAALFGWRRSRR